MKYIILILSLLLAACGGGGSGGGNDPIIPPAPPAPTPGPDPLTNFWYYDFFQPDTYPGVQVLVADTGFMYWHEDLQGQFSELIDRSGKNDPTDYDGHGTVTSGVVGMVRDNSVGGFGTYDKVKMIGYKVYTGKDKLVDLVNPIYYAADHGIEVVTISWSGCCSSSAVAAAAQYAFDRGTTVVYAAGNNSTDMTSEEGYIDSDAMIVVGAIFEDFYDRASWSNYGPPIDLMGPATVTTTNMYGGYSSVSGTSVAAPYVAGIVARKYVELNPPGSHVGSAMIRDAVFADAMTLGDPYEYGHGLARVQ